MTTATDLANLDAELANAQTAITSSQASVASLKADLLPPPPPPPSAITVTSAGPFAGTVGQQAIFNLRATTTKAGANIRWNTSTPQPNPFPGGSWSGNLDMIGTPTAAGTYVIDFAVTDGTNTVPVAVTIVIAPATTPVPPVPPAPPSTTGLKLGGFILEGGAPTDEPALVAFGKQIGVTFSYEMDFLDGGSWGSMEADASAFASFAAAHRNEIPNWVCPVNPFPTGGSWDQAASGAYNANYAQIATNLVSNGLPDSIIRMAWEFNGSGWFNFNSPPPTAQQFVAWWNHMHDSMMAVPGAKFTWFLNPTLGDPAGLGPLDAWVDPILSAGKAQFLGPDIYNNQQWSDQLAQTNGLDWYDGKYHQYPTVIPMYGEWGRWKPDSQAEASFESLSGGWIKARNGIAMVWSDGNDGVDIRTDPTFIAGLVALAA